MSTVPTSSLNTQSTSSDSSSRHSLYRDSSSRDFDSSPEAYSRKAPTDKVILFYSQDQRDTAQQIQKSNSEHVTLGEISWKRLDDNYPCIRIENAEQVRGARCAFLASFQRPDNLFEQLAVIYALPRHLAASFQVIIPYLPMRFDRVDTFGDIASARTMAHLLSETPATKGGPSVISTYDMNSQWDRLMFSDQVQVNERSTIPLFIKRLKEEKDIVIAYPTDEAYLRFNNMLRDYDYIRLERTRDRESNRRTSRITSGDPKGKHCVIVDTVLETGQTISSTAKTLKDHGASRIDAFTPHVSNVFTKERAQQIQSAGINTFYTTDSNPQMTRNLRDMKPFDVMSLSECIGSNLAFQAQCK